MTEAGSAGVAIAEFAKAHDEYSQRLVAELRAAAQPGPTRTSVA